MQLQVRSAALMWGETVKYHVSATWVIWEVRMSCHNYSVVSMPSRLHVSRCVFRQLIKTNLIKYKKAIVDIAPQWGAPYNRL